MLTSVAIVKNVLTVHFNVEQTPLLRSGLTEACTWNIMAKISNNSHLVAHWSLTDNFLGEEERMVVQSVKVSHCRIEAKCSFKQGIFRMVMFPVPFFLIPNAWLLKTYQFWSICFTSCNVSYLQLFFDEYCEWVRCDIW